MVTFNNDWDEVLKDLTSSPLYQKIRKFLIEEYSNHTIYPPMNDIFTAFKLTAFKDVKVVILGQDPYHEPDQAHGLCFSVVGNVKNPPSLVNIFKELESDLGILNTNGNLENWAKQGVLLLNTSLTVRRGQANSHKNCGWTEFTDEVIKLVSKKAEPVVFILWGNNARSKKKFIAPHHKIIESAHPSPLSCYNGFFGSKPFSKTNEFLLTQNKPAIDWKT